MSVAPPPGRRIADRAHGWTRRLHFYLGLYLLVFIWFFSVSGLVLDHSKWAVAHFWDARRETTLAHDVRVPPAGADVAMAADLMRQLDVVGEVDDIERAADGSSIAFQVVKPGRVFRVETRLDSARARVTEIRLNTWGVMDALHKFTGVRIDDPARTRDWLLTRVWSAAMDAVAIGLIVLVFSGVYLWYRLKPKRLTGLVALLLGVACCGFFLSGLGALFG